MTDVALSDAELLAAAARGDERAFGTLVRRHIRAATLLAAQWMGDRDDAEDVVQEAFTVVYRDVGEFDVTRAFSPWLFAIVRRIAANRRARDRRRQRLTERWGSDRETSTPAPDSGVVAALEGEAVRAAMGSLSPMQRACFELVVTRGLSPREVAEMHDIAESTVRQHVFRARAALREQLT